MKPFFAVFSFLVVFLAVSACRVRTAPPELTTIRPDTAYAGQEITLGGFQFGADPVVTFSRAGTATMAKVISSSEQSLRVVVPLIAPGLAQVRVQTGQGISDPLPFTIIQPQPLISDRTPMNGLPGTTVVITGNYLNQLDSVQFIQTRSVRAIVKDSSATKLTLVVPDKLPRGPHRLVIKTKGGTTETDFIVAGTPQITSLSTKKAKRGAELIIQGVNLTDGIVRINDLFFDRNQTTVKDTEIRTVIPDNATSGKITVTVFDRLVATSADSIQIVLQPSVANLSARDGIAGDKITLTGLNLRDVSGVTFGGTTVPFRVLNDTQLEATVPVVASPVSLVVAVNSVGGNATAPDPFFVYVAPSNLTVSPTRQLRLQAITITGQNLYRITEVRVSGIAVPITSRIEGSQILVNVPADAVSGSITVSNRAGTATSQPLTVVQPAVVTDIIPVKARPGDRVVLRGNFLLNAQIFFTGSTTAAADGGKNTDTERWVLVPSDAQTGPLRVINTTNTATFTDLFTALRLVTNVDFTPKSGKAGDELVFTGQNLLTTQEIRFSNGTSTAAKFFLNGTAFTVTVPAGATTGQICITNEAGTTCTSATFTVTK